MRVSICVRHRRPGSTILVFGGFDSYVEEFLPMLATMVDAGHRVIAFEGPVRAAPWSSTVFR
jgi:hypothetical protein